MNLKLHVTPSQTVGPFFSLGFTWLNRDDLAGGQHRGDVLKIQGRIVDGDGQPVPDACIEIWQADPQGKYPNLQEAQSERDEHNGREGVGQKFTGFGRVPTNAGGYFSFKTVKPGRVPGPDGQLQAPHIVVSIFARGLLRRLVTRIYFPDEPGNANDFVMNLVEPTRRGTLVATRSNGDGNVLEWNVILQGAGETVFFDC